MAGNSLTKLAFASTLVISTITIPVVASAQTGIASIYSGGRTANGENARASGLTAAHRTLPFGTMVRVTNQRSGRSVVVRINDRGPFIRGRVIDVTPAAAHVLGFSGLAPVTLAVVGRSIFLVPYAVSQSSAASSDKRRRETRGQTATAGGFGLPLICASAESVGNRIVHTQATIVGQHCRPPPRP